MSIKKGILYQIHHPKKSWVEEISMVYKKRESTGLFPAEKYEGEIENGEPNGHGILTGTDEGTYIGEWKNGLFHGQGTFTYGWMDGNTTWVCIRRSVEEWYLSWSNNYHLSRWKEV